MFLQTQEFRTGVVGSDHECDVIVVHSIGIE